MLPGDLGSPAGLRGPIPAPCRPGGSPADVFGVSGEADRPLGDAELSAVGGWLRVTFALKALTLAGVEVLQDAARKCRNGQGPDPSGYHVPTQQTGPCESGSPMAQDLCFIISILYLCYN